jgi:hypothetical protein
MAVELCFAAIVQCSEGNGILTAMHGPKSLNFFPSSALSLFLPFPFFFYEYVRTERVKNAEV